MTKKQYIKEAKKHGVKLHIDQDMLENKQDPFWYGGTIAWFNYGCYIIHINATGIIRADLYDKKGEHIAHIKDEHDAAIFEKEVSPYINNDEELREAIDDGRLVIHNNNWFEATIYDIASQEDIGVHYDTVSFDLEDALDVSGYIEMLREEVEK